VRWVLGAAGVFAGVFAGVAVVRSEDPAPRDADAVAAPGDRNRSAVPVERVASETELRAYLAELARRSSAVTSLRVRFRQEKRLRLLRRPRVSSAELAFAAGKLCVTTRGRDGEIESRLLAADGELRIHYPALERVEVFPSRGDPTRGDPSRGDPSRGGGIDQGRSASLPLFTGDWKTLEKRYRVEMAVESALARADEDDAEAETEPVVRLRLTPRADEKAAGDRAGESAARVEIALVDHRVREYLQVEANGDRVRMEILSWEVDVELSAAYFTLDIPDGTRVVRIGDAR